MVREEQPYIEEFVQYHLSIGVDLIYIYDNDNVPTYGHMFPCHPRVKVVFVPWMADTQGIVFKVCEVLAAGPTPHPHPVHSIQLAWTVLPQAAVHFSHSL